MGTAAQGVRVSRLDFFEEVASSHNSVSQNDCKIAGLNMTASCPRLPSTGWALPPPVHRLDGDCQKQARPPLHSCPAPRAVWQRRPGPFVIGLQAMSFFGAQVKARQHVLHALHRLRQVQTLAPDRGAGGLGGGGNVGCLPPAPRRSSLRAPCPTPPGVSAVPPVGRGIAGKARGLLLTVTVKSVDNSSGAGQAWAGRGARPAITPLML